LASHLQIDADPDLDPALHFDLNLDPLITLMRIRICNTNFNLNLLAPFSCFFNEQLLNILRKLDLYIIGKFLLMVVVGALDIFLLTFLRVLVFLK